MKLDAAYSIINAVIAGLLVWAGISAAVAYILGIL
jgi:hypothetical protein